MLQNYKTYHLKKSKEKNQKQLEKGSDKEKYLLQSYQGGHISKYIFQILILAIDETVHSIPS